jgi:hypothetical protein
MENEGSLPCSQEPALVAILSQLNLVHIFYCCSIHEKASQEVSTFQGFLTKILYAFIF